MPHFYVASIVRLVGSYCERHFYQVKRVRDVVMFLQAAQQVTEHRGPCLREFRLRLVCADLLDKIPRLLQLRPLLDASVLSRHALVMSRKASAESSKSIPRMSHRPACWARSGTSADGAASHRVACADVDNFRHGRDCCTTGRRDEPLTCYIIRSRDGEGRHKHRTRSALNRSRMTDADGGWGEASALEV